MSTICGGDIVMPAGTTFKGDSFILPFYLQTKRMKGKDS
jgi:hypothetical protein